MYNRKELIQMGVGAAIIFLFIRQLVFDEFLVYNANGELVWAASRLEIGALLGAGALVSIAIAAAGWHLYHWIERREIAVPDVSSAK